MRQPILPVVGHCRCAATQFKVLTPPLMTFACHCRDCQRLCASAFSLSAMIPVDGFRITRGVPVARPLPGSPRHHHFCPDCATLMFTRIDGIEERVNIRPTLCHDTSWAAPFIEVMTRDRVPWAATSARHSFDIAPTPAEFANLLAQFAAFGTTP
ncbi:MAG: GFA family protein [Pseudomonadota bacterium]